MRFRRLVGPTIISLILCGLIADKLFLSESRWSVTRLLGRLLGTVSTVFAPPSSPAFYNWLGWFWLPFSLCVLALGLLWFVFAGAKRAMSKATDEGGVVLTASSVRAVAEDQKARTAPHGAFLDRLVWTVGGIVAVFGIVVCATAYSVLGPAVEGQAKQRAAVMAMGLREIVGPVLPGRESEIAAAIEKYAARNHIVYVYVEDGSGQVVAHWPRALLRYLNRDFPWSSERALGGVESDYRGEKVYGIASLAGDGSAGFVHLAVDMNKTAAEVRRTVVTIGGVFLVISLCVVGALLWIARSLKSPWSELVDHADRISHGDFAVSLALQRSDEIGDIARSLERMRSSLRAVTARLEQEQAMRRSNE